MAENAIGVLLVVEALGASIEKAAAALAEFEPAKGRGERFVLEGPSGPFTIIDESYNANPVSMRAALALLGETEPGPGGRRIAGRFSPSAPGTCDRSAGAKEIRNSERRLRGLFEAQTGRQVCAF